MTSIVIPVRINVPEHLKALKEEHRTLTELAKELGRNSAADYGSALGHEAKTPGDQYTAQMFARALVEVTGIDCGVGLVSAHYGTWEHPVIGEDGKPVMTDGKKPKRVFCEDLSFG